jgi:hypothetical protein
MFRSQLTDLQSTILALPTQEINTSDFGKLKLKVRLSTALQRWFASRYWCHTHMLPAKPVPFHTQIAQLLTVSREQEIKEGQIDRRDWRRKQCVLLSCYLHGCLRERNSPEARRCVRVQHVY